MLHPYINDAALLAAFFFVPLLAIPLKPKATLKHLQVFKAFILAIATVAIPLSKRTVIPANENKDKPFIFHCSSEYPSFVNPTSKTSLVAALDQSDWYGSAVKDIQLREYKIQWDKKKRVYESPNRKNNLRFYYNANGFIVQPRAIRIPLSDVGRGKRPEETKYRTVPNWKVKFDLDKKQVGKGSWNIVDNKAEYITNNITVQYLNNNEGMRQNFIVHSPLSKSSSLKVNLGIKTKLKPVLNNNRLQFLYKKNVVLNYEDLKVWDAKGKVLASNIRKNKRNKYTLNVNTTGAVYPITIDPINTSPATMLECNQAGAHLGDSVSSAGDVNGDGYSDVIVGAGLYDNGQSNEGAAFIYYGSSSGINVATASLVESNKAGSGFGGSVSTAGDVNGDGYSDVIVGAPYYDNGTITGAGAFYIFLGSPTGIVTTAATIVLYTQKDGNVGFAVASAGDINGDGYSDVVIGAPFYDYLGLDSGAGFIYYGSASGLNTTATMLTISPFSLLGWSVASAGDVNGDGYSDVILGAYFYSNGQSSEGGALIYHGSASGIITTAAVTLESNQANAFFGASVASAGDVNGDGYSDVVVGAPEYDNGQTNEGAVFIYHGSATGVNPVAATMIESNIANIKLGLAVCCAGDINGDGYSDIVLGTPLYSNGEANEGIFFVYIGSATGISTTAIATVESNQVGAYLGYSVASAGDVNGDGYSDIIVGAQFYDNGQADEGAAFVYHGSANGINSIAATSIESNQTSAEMGFATATAGDINGDGYSDIIVGAYRYDNGQHDEGAVFIYYGSSTGINSTPAAMMESDQADALMGYSVASAGDVNADGYSDIVVGVYDYDDGEVDEGAAFIYHGSAIGIITTPAAILECNQAYALMGVSVASAGDVNGDGYSDVIVGAWFYSNGQFQEGVAFVYHGSATGVNTIPAALLESNQNGAGMGAWVSTAGDVNGDGYSDVIVGVIAYDNGETDEGAAFVYHGSAAGINTSPAAILERNKANALMGRCVASAGDVNGDGYSDVVVGAYNYDDGLTSQGVAFVYYGSATGINTASFVTLEYTRATARLGFSVGCAGDVNGDGYSDIVVGAYTDSDGESFEGVVFIYFGSNTGISTTPSAILEKNITSALFGASAGTAGDVNGDGYSDLLVGAMAYTNGQPAEGAAFIYLGDSSGNNKRNNLRLYNSDLITRVNNSNFTFGNFGAGLYAKSFLGRSKGKMVWETRLNYNAYSGNPITNSVSYTSQQSSYTDLGLTGAELKNLITKLLSSGKFTKLRARVKYDPVTAITGQVYGPWRNASSVIDGNGLGVLPIELISFKAAWLQKGKTAQLNFTTDKESGICCFDIEKSLDGFNFSSIGIVPAKNIAGVLSYVFIDNKASSKKQFYRLKIKGVAGQEQYSNIQQLQYNNATEILVFPNPAANVLQLQLNNNYDKMNVQIVNNLGQIVKQFNALPVTNQSITLPIASLPSGNYWLRLQAGSDKLVIQFTKQ